MSSSFQFVQSSKKAKDILKFNADDVKPCTKHNLHNQTNYGKLNILSKLHPETVNDFELLVCNVTTLDKYGVIAPKIKDIMTVDRVSVLERIPKRSFTTCNIKIQELVFDVQLDNAFIPLITASSTWTLRKDHQSSFGGNVKLDLFVQCTVSDFGKAFYTSGIAPECRESNCNKPAKNNLDTCSKHNKHSILTRTLPCAFCLTDSFSN